MPPEFPFTAVRDLLGILRLLYAEELERKHANEAKLAAIKKIGDALRRSIRLAADHDAGTAPYVKALEMAEAATLKLGNVFVDMFGMPESENALVKIAARRVRGQWAKYRESEREVKWAVGKLRR